MSKSEEDYQRAKETQRLCIYNTFFPERDVDYIDLAVVLEFVMEEAIKKGMTAQEISQDFIEIGLSKRVLSEDNPRKVEKFVRLAHRVVNRTLADWIEKNKNVKKEDWPQDWPEDLKDKLSTEKPIIEDGSSPPNDESYRSEHWAKTGWPDEFTRLLTKL